MISDQLSCKKPLDKQTPINQLTENINEDISNKGKEAKKKVYPEIQSIRRIQVQATSKPLWAKGHTVNINLKKKQETEPHPP